jgi:hypothetical protein
MDNLMESALNAAALRPKTQEPERILQAMVEWHRANESETLPTALLCMLVAARMVC